MTVPSKQMHTGWSTRLWLTAGVVSLGTIAHGGYGIGSALFADPVLGVAKRINSFEPNHFAIDLNLHGHDVIEGHLNVLNNHPRCNVDQHDIAPKIRVSLMSEHESSNAGAAGVIVEPKLNNFAHELDSALLSAPTQIMGLTYPVHFALSAENLENDLLQLDYSKAAIDHLLNNGTLRLSFELVGGSCAAITLAVLDPRSNDRWNAYYGAETVLIAPQPAIQR